MIGKRVENGGAGWCSAFGCCVSLSTFGNARNQDCHQTMAVRNVLGGVAA